MDAFARIHKAIDYLKDKGIIHKQRDIVEMLNGNESNITQALKGNARYLTKPFLRRFAKAYSEFISEDWLVDEKGKMEVPDKNLRPHYDAQAAAGFLDGISEGKMSAEFRAMAIPTLNYDFSIDVRGDSMSPKIEDGDTLLCRKSNDRLNLPIGKICLLDTKEGFVVKEILKVGEESITIHSINPAYADREIEFSNILGVAEVVGLIRTSL